MISKHSLTCLLSLQCPVREMGHRLNSGAFYSFDSKAALGALHTTINEKKNAGVQKSPDERGPKGSSGVCCPKCAPETYGMARLSPSCASSPFSRGGPGPTPSTVIGPLHAPPVEMPSSVPSSSISASIVSSIPSPKASSTSLAVSREEKC